MQFASFAFLAFLSVTAIVYFALPRQEARAVWLLVASCFFYYLLSARWSIALLFIVVVGYVFGRLMDTTEVGDRRRSILAVAGVTTVIATLAFFKFSQVSGQLIEHGLRLLPHPPPFSVESLILPVGISFWTFTTISYLVDVAKGMAPERNPVYYALFISFFPHVTAGPISRTTELLPQLKRKFVFSYDNMKSALWLMGWGFAKKMLVADPMGQFVDYVYSDPHRFGGQRQGVGIVLTLAAVGFAIQIYCDFSGYTDIVRGAARLFGIDLSENFNRPYFARSVKEFWQRWHISLMAWLRNYVYFPLGGNRVPQWRRYFNIIAVFLVSAVWHGVGWTFIVWGLLNAVYQIIGELTLPAKMACRRALRVDPDQLWYRALQTLSTFVLVTVAWVFFRAESLPDALFVVRYMFVPTFSGFSAQVLDGLRMPSAQAAVMCATILLVIVVELRPASRPFEGLVRQQPLPVRWTVYFAVILVLLVCGYYGPAYNSAGFVYFRF